MSQELHRFEGREIGQFWPFRRIEYHEMCQSWSIENTGNPGSVIVPQYRSSKITVFVWGKNTILKFLLN